MLYSIVTMFYSMVKSSLIKATMLRTSTVSNESFVDPYPYIRIKRVDKPQLNRGIKHVNSNTRLDLKVS